MQHLLCSRTCLVAVRTGRYKFDNNTFRDTTTFIYGSLAFVFAVGVRVKPFTPALTVSLCPTSRVCLDLFRHHVTR
jgi:hypothetical protein